MADSCQWVGKAKHMPASIKSPNSLTRSPLNQQGLPIQDVVHAGCDPPKWLTVSPQHQCKAGKLCLWYRLQSLANIRCSKTAGPVYSARLPFVWARAAVITPGTTGRQRFLMTHFYSGDKVSYPRRLKRPWGAVEWQLWDARQSHGDTQATGEGRAQTQRDQMKVWRNL